MKALSVVNAPRDGDCLFHALAHFDNYSGKALRLDVANFLEKQAVNQFGFEEEWLQEAAKLRDNKWGGHTAIIAYSLMARARVMLHTLDGETGTLRLEEASHSLLYGKDGVRVIHLLYNNIDHYDALAEVTRDAPKTVVQQQSQTIGLQELDFPSLFAPVSAYSQAYIASWTTQHADTISVCEANELLRLAGWLLQLHCMPPPTTHQFRRALRDWQSTLRQHFRDRLLPWPWSFMIHGMLL